MAFEEIRQAAGVAPSRPVRNALISNIDNPAAQQYAQVSAFTSFLENAVQPSTPSPVSNPTPASGFQLFAPPQAASGQAASTLNYSASGTTNPVTNPNQPGRFVSLTV